MSLPADISLSLNYASIQYTAHTLVGLAVGTPVLELAVSRLTNTAHAKLMMPFLVS